MAIKSKYVVKGSHKIHYEISQGKNYIFFIHGSGNNGSMWWKYREFFSKKGYGTIILDLRLFGKSTGSFDKNYYALDNFVDDIHDILKKEKINKVHIVGFSMGTLIQQRFSAKYPKKVISNIMIAPSYNVKETFVTNIWKKILFLNAQRIKQIFLLYRDIIFLGKDKIRPIMDQSQVRKKGLAFICEYYTSSSKEYHKKTFVASKAFYEWDTRIDAQNTNTPTYILQGEKDTLVPKKTAYTLCKMIPGCKKPIILQGQGHDGVLYNQQLYLREIEHIISFF